MILMKKTDNNNIIIVIPINAFVDFEFDDGNGSSSIIIIGSNVIQAVFKTSITLIVFEKKFLLSSRYRIPIDKNATAKK